MTEQIKIKLVVLGAENTGKTQFVQYIINGIGSCDFDHYVSTSSVSYLSRNIIFKNKAFKLEVWDTAGKEKYKALLKIFFKDANMIYIFFDYNNKKTFDYAKSLYDYVNNSSTVDHLVCAFVGNKSPRFCEAMVALAGPMMNFLLAIVFTILLYVIKATIC